jgi:hypothetical protein
VPSVFVPLMCPTPSRLFPNLNPSPTMCFYSRTDFVCGDWKWGNMKEQCPREHRTGETCGAKLSHIDSNITSPQLCRICTEITTKRRRLAKAQADLTRYTIERKLPALAAAKEQEVQDIQQALVKLNDQRISSKHLHSRDITGRHHEQVPQRHRPMPSISSTHYPVMQIQDSRYRHQAYGHTSEASPFALRI